MPAPLADKNPHKAPPPTQMPANKWTGKIHQGNALTIMQKLLDFMLTHVGVVLTSRQLQQSAAGRLNLGGVGASYAPKNGELKRIGMTLP